MTGELWAALLDGLLEALLEERSLDRGIPAALDAIERLGGCPSRVARDGRPAWASPGAAGRSDASAEVIPLRSESGERLGALYLFSPPATLDRSRVASVISLLLSSWVDQEDAERARHRRNNRLAAALSNVELAAALVEGSGPPSADEARQARFALGLARDALIDISEEARGRGSNE